MIYAAQAPVKNMPPRRLSTTYCECGEGWAKTLFEGATGRPVEVVREKTILGGGEECRFNIVFFYIFDSLALLLLESPGWEFLMNVLVNCYD